MPDWFPLSPEALALMGLLLMLFFYLRFIARRSRFRAQPAPPMNPEMLSDTELERYARHIVMRDIGGTGQKRLKGAKVLVVGAGGLGAPILAYLCAAGVGTIGVIDDDTVSFSNLQRQILFDEGDLDRPKVFAAVDHLAQQNPFVNLRTYYRRLSEDIAADLVADYDLVIDGCDNFETRALLNRACVARQIPLISGAISQWEGQISLFSPANGGPCYACLFPTPPADGLNPSCAQAGVLGALPGAIGAIMAAEAIKYITRSGQNLQGRLLLVNLLDHHYRIVACKARPECHICGGADDT